MSNQYYDFYLADVFRLTKSLVIKSEASAELINKNVQLMDINYVAPEDKKLWKYYQNLAGNYFYLDTEFLRDYNYRNNLKVNIRKNITLMGLDIVNQYIDLHDYAYSENFILKDPSNNVMEMNVDFTYSFKGGDDGKSRITFIGDYALGGPSELLPNDQIFLSYYANNGKLIIKSIDTLEDIEFTKENLLPEFAVDDRLLHRATYAAYYPGSSYFDELVRRYPDQEILIRGIVTPVDIDVAVDSKDHQIVYFDKLLVEENEISLIKNIQKWIDTYFIRWNVPAYGLIDELYVPSHLGILWLQLPLVILNLRLAACKTHEAHSYHIKQYLASHHKLDKNFDLMTKKQQLFFYRNIRYIQRNPGKTQTFDKLLGKVLTDRTIPLNAWNLNHNVKQIGEKVHPELPEDEELFFTSSSEMTFESLNGLTSDVYKKTNTVLDVLLKQTEIAKDNFETIPDNKEYTEWYFDNSQYSHLKTKTLESNMIDYTEAQPYKFADTVLNHWLYLAWKEGVDERPRYNAAITIKHPNTGDDLNLTSLDAFILFLYSFNMSTGNTFEGEIVTITATHISNQWIDLEVPVTAGSVVLSSKGHVCTEGTDYSVSTVGGVGGVARITLLPAGYLSPGADTEMTEGHTLHVSYHHNGGDIPIVRACRVRRIELPILRTDLNPPIDELREVVDKSVIGVEYSEAVLNGLPVIGSYSSIEAFHSICMDIWHGVLKHRELHSLVEDMDNRAYVEQMVDMCYQDVDIDLGDGRTFDDWFTEKELVLENLSRGEWLDLAMNLLNTATGVVFNRKKSLRQIQESMIGIMSKLSSYSVQFLKNMIDNLIIVDWLAIRFSENKNNYFASDLKQVHIEDMDIGYNAKGYANEELDLTLIGEELNIFIKAKENQSVSSIVETAFNVFDSTNLIAYIPMANLMSVEIKPYIPSGRWTGLPFP